MNIGKMMKDLQKMQSKMQDDLETVEIEGSAGGGVVTARMNGKKELLAIKLSPEAITPEDTTVERKSLRPDRSLRWTTPGPTATGPRRRTG